MGDNSAELTRRRPALSCSTASSSSLIRICNTERLNTKLYPNDTLSVSVSNAY